MKALEHPTSQVEGVLLGDERPNCQRALGEEGLQ